MFKNIKTLGGWGFGSHPTRGDYRAPRPPAHTHTPKTPTPLSGLLAFRVSALRALNLLLNYGLSEPCYATVCVYKNKGDRSSSCI